MHIRRIQTKQGHAVPKTAGYARGPFPPELFETSPVVYEYEPQPDGGEEVPVGSTAQNDFKPIKWFRCKECKDIVPESQLGTHMCEDSSGEN